MMTRRQLAFMSGYALLLLGVMGIAAFFADDAPESAATATPTRTSAMTYPANYRDDFAHYLTVERIDDTVRHLYIDKAALANIKRGQPLPNGTQLIIETYEDAPFGLSTDDDIPGELQPFIHVAEKRDNWQREVIASSVTLDGWNFESFTADSGHPSDENRSDCFTCHDTSAFDSDFVFSRSFIDRYIRTGETYSFTCHRPNRQPCF